MGCSNLHFPRRRCLVACVVTLWVTSALAAPSFDRIGRRAKLLVQGQDVQTAVVSGRRLLVEEFKGAPPAEEKAADAARILGQRPDNLLRNLKIKKQKDEEMFPEGCAVSEDSATKRYKTLTAGDSNIVDTAGACADSCRDAKRSKGKDGECNAWFWCNDQEGCETEAGLPLPFHACQLQQQKASVPIEPPTSWKPARFVAGYEGANGSRKPVPPETRVAVIAPVTADRCPLAFGMLSLMQAFINKHDYARLHSYEFHSKPVLKDAAVPGTWYRMLLIKQVLAELPAERAGWVLFADQDVLADEVAFTMPLDQYAGKDLVLWGSSKLVSTDTYQQLLSVSHKDRQQGLDTGVLLLRNSDWSREFVDDALAFMLDEAKQATLKASLKTWEPLLYEQNAVAYLLQQPATMAHVAFETEYCINCAWAHGNQGKLPFLKRFSECSFCTGFRNSREQMFECNTELVKTFAFANRMVFSSLGCGQGDNRAQKVLSSDPGPRSTSGSGDSSVSTQRLHAASEEAAGQSPMFAMVDLLQTHFMSIAFVGVFCMSVCRTCCCKRRRRSRDQ